MTAGREREKRVVDHAATKEEAVELRDMYIAISAAKGVKGWLFGYEWVSGKAGYVIYMRRS